MNCLFTKDEYVELEYAKTIPVVFDEDCPETIPERALRFKRVNPMQSLGVEEAKNLFSKYLAEE